MILENQLAVGLSPEALFPLLADLERVAPCLPGATITERVDATTFRGRVTVKIGPITVGYEGTATIVEVAPDARRLVMRCEGRDPRGAGSALATIIATVESGPDGGAVGRIQSDVAITGRIAQFGRGVIEDVASRLLTQFAQCVERSIVSGAGPVGPQPPMSGLPPTEPAPAPVREAAVPAPPPSPTGGPRGTAPPAAPPPAAAPGLVGLVARVLWVRLRRLLARTGGSGG